MTEIGEMRGGDRRTDSVLFWYRGSSVGDSRLPGALGLGTDLRVPGRPRVRVRIGGRRRVALAVLVSLPSF